MESQITIFKNLKNPHEGVIVPLDEVFYRIKNGNSEALVKEIRNGKKDAKKQLPCVVFSGKFSKRNSNGLEKHSGLMVLDFDDFKPEELSENQKTINSNKHVLSSFISPSGNGIKAIIRVPDTLNKDTHPQYYKAFRDEFKLHKLDVSGSDLARVCFESYDPNIYINYDAETYKPKISKLVVKLPTPEVIFTAPQEDIIKFVMKSNFSTSFIDGQKNSHVLKIAGMMCERGVNKSNAESYIMTNIVNGNCKDESAKLQTIRDAYSIREFNSSPYEDLKKKSRIQHKIVKGTPIKQIVKDEGVTTEVIEKIQNNLFWYEEKGKIKIDIPKFGKFLNSKGFKKYFPPGSKSPVLVKINKNIVTEVSPVRISDFVTDFMENDPALFGVYVSNPYLSSEKLLFLVLKSFSISTLRDTKDKSFIPYKNGVLEVTKDSKKLVSYEEIDFYIWESQILQRDYIQHDDNNNDYKKFVSNISHETPQALESVIGYLLSTYKNKMNNKAIILNDEVISDNPEGGTGKGLLMQGIDYMRNTCILDGKNFDDKKSFAYQTVTQETQVLIFDDVKKNFNLESKFSIITEGLTLERKNKDAIKLSVEESPKIVISTNYVIQGDGNSHHRRVHEVEISQYYGKNLTPGDEFKRNLFEDWEKEDWEKFDNYMVMCLQSYIKDGLQELAPKNLKLRKLIGATCKDFVDFMEDGNVLFNRELKKAEIFQLFTNEYQDYNNQIFKRKTFDRWIKKYASYKDNLVHNEGSKGGYRWFSLNTKAELKDEDLSNILF